MEGAKRHPELLPCEAVICRPRGLEILPPSHRGVMKLMSGKKNLLILITMNKIKFFFNDIKPKVRIKRILGDTENGWIGAEEFPKLVNLRFIPRTLIADVAKLVEYVSKELSLLSKDVREGCVNGRVGKGALLLLLLPPKPLAPSRSVSEGNTILLSNKIG